MPVDQNKLKEAQNFYDKYIKKWMIGSLRKAVGVDINFLTALGCLVYTEVIGIFLPPFKNESGSIEKKRFYRCLFRFASKDYLKILDREILKETNRDLYENLRHSMTHIFIPSIKKRKNGVILFLPSVVARNGIVKDPSSEKKYQSAPIFLDDKNNRLVIAIQNYISELENAVEGFYNLTFVKNKLEYQQAAVDGIDVVLRGK